MENNRHIKIKTAFVDDVKLDDFFINMVNTYGLDEALKRKTIIEDFLNERLAYNHMMVHREGKLIERIKVVTINEIISDIEGILKQNHDFRIGLELCMALDDCIDFEKTNINVEIPIDINNEEQRFLEKLKSCPKVIVIGNGIKDTPENSKEWLKNINISYVIDREGEEIELPIEEILEKYKVFREYSEQAQEYAISYNYFIKQEIEIDNSEVFKDLEDIEDWRVKTGRNNEKIRLKFNVGKSKINECVKKYYNLLNKNDKYYAEINEEIINLPKFFDKGKLFQVLTKEKLEKIQKYEEKGIHFIAGVNDNISFYAETIAEINESILGKYNMQYVTIGRKENRWEAPLQIDEYKSIRRILDDVVKGINVNDSEENKIKEVYTRLAYMLTYDYEAAEDETQYAKDNEVNSRNLVNGLLYGKCVCAGYTEILRQSLSLVGIEAHYISSKDNEKKSSHAYNIVKVNGNLYNVDLTWDSDDIRIKKQPKYFLKNDKDFRKIEEKNRNLHIPEEENYECTAKSLNLYPEYKKYTSFKEFIEEKKKEIANVTKMIKAKVTPKKKTLAEATINPINKKETRFLEELKKETPTLEEQAEMKQPQENNEMTLDENKEIEDI